MLVRCWYEARRHRLAHRYIASVHGAHRRLSMADAGGARCKAGVNRCLAPPAVESFLSKSA